MLFSELYSAYYNAVAAILKKAVQSELSLKDIPALAERYAFGESFIRIEKSLRDGTWPLLSADCGTPLKYIPRMPLTALQKRWLKAVSLDPRIKLFCGDSNAFPDFEGVEPLFTQEDYCVFDSYSDGDDYSDEEYIKHFRTVLDAVRNRYPLNFEILNKVGEVKRFTALPERIEYSEKDDKFRVITSGFRFGRTVNIARIVSCSKSGKPLAPDMKPVDSAREKVVFELTDERKALERVLLHFAHFEKEAEHIDGKFYRVTLLYDRNDETEILIRILSFGPFVKVTEPARFVGLIKERLEKQYRFGFI